MDCLLEAYSQVKKCSANGRALMSLDVQMIRTGLREIVPLPSIPNCQLVDNFIKAHFLVEEEILDWVRNHPEYKLKYVHALINNFPGMEKKKKTKTELLNKATEIFASRSPQSTPFQNNSTNQ
eukprot:c20338_g1_i1.p1 GENE.c20338_g1_i1~~c20338_g1_i1.p1  ORF type:complete len:123 (+),score=48.05 c20338_g1_i1:29-397(+)